HARVGQRAHNPVRKTPPRLDHPRAAPPPASRPVDRDHHRRLRPARPRPPASRRPQAALGTPRQPRLAHPRPGPPRLPPASPRPAPTSKAPKTLPRPPLTTQSPPPPPRQTLPRDQKKPPEHRRTLKPKSEERPALLPRLDHPGRGAQAGRLVAAGDLRQAGHGRVPRQPGLHRISRVLEQAGQARRPGPGDLRPGSPFREPVRRRADYRPPVAAAP